MTIFDLKTGENHEKFGENVAFAENFMSYGIPDVAELISRAEKYKLKHREVLNEFTYEQICDEFNGVGPDRWSQELRDILSWVFQDVLEAVMVHDMDYVKGGTHEEFLEANAVLAKNVRRLARKKYHWWQARRYFLYVSSVKMEQLTNEFGWEGWNKTDDVESGFCADSSTKAYATTYDV